MRRTTICRSSRAVLLALVAGLLGVPGLGAQDTTRAAADPVRAQGADTVTAARVDTTVVDTAQLVEAPPPPPGPAETYETIFDRGRSRTAEVQDILRAYANQPYRPLRRGEFYAAGFLSERERSEEHTSELQSLAYLVCRLLLEKKKTGPRASLPSSA